MFATAGVAALAVTGCFGADGQDRKVLSAGEYRKQVNALCASVKADLEPETDNLTGRADEDADTLTGLIPTLEDRNRKFLGLVPPDELVDTGDGFAFTNEEQLGAYRKAAKAAQDGDQKAYRAALTRLEEIQDEVDDRATVLRTDECKADA